MIQSVELQLAIDTPDLDKALNIAKEAYPYFDILEIGTPLVIEKGLTAFDVMKEHFKDKKILVDTKITDAGYLEASSVFKRKADLLTVLAMADDRTIQGALKAANEFSGKVMIDLLNTADPVKRAKEVEALGVDIICLHTAYDRKDTKNEPLAELKEVKSQVNCKIGIAGGMTKDTVKDAISLGADLIVVGGAITNQSNITKAAEEIYKIIKRED